MFFLFIKKNLIFSYVYQMMLVIYYFVLFFIESVLVYWLNIIFKIQKEIVVIDLFIVMLIDFIEIRKCKNSNKLINIELV